ncbi:MAG TPA: phosphate ABC transporter permease PstA [Caulobacteraceae bacterium]|nr:phosphate ABC transporter permease PstA [Caulobacteraceae bacterium]
MTVSAARVASRRLSNGVFVGFCYFVTAIALAFLAAVLWTLIQKGIGGISLDTFTMDTPASGSRGGLLNAIIGSILLCGLAMAIALFIGILAGTWLAEYAGDGRYGSAVRFINDVLLSAPSILVGLFIWYLLVAHLIHHFSGIAGSLALSLIAIPVIARTTEDVLRLQPTSLRESGAALGTPLWTVIRAILWRAGGSGILTGALLAFARISGETAPLLFTALNNQFRSFDMTHEMANLPVVMFNDALSAYDDLERLAWAAALIVSVSVLGVIIIARVLTREQKSR